MVVCKKPIKDEERGEQIVERERERQSKRDAVTRQVILKLLCQFQDNDNNNIKC